MYEMKVKWMFVGLIGIFLIVSIYLLVKRMPESFLAPYYTPSPSVFMRDGLISVERAQEEIPFEIIEPEYLPVGFTFLGAHVSGTKITLIYEDSNGRRITLSEWQNDEQEHHPYPGETVVTINGIKGWFSIPGPYSLRWDCDNVAISLIADLTGGKEAVMVEMIKIVESMQC
jgi:hypothetical protein